MTVAFPTETTYGTPVVLTGSQFIGMKFPVPEPIIGKWLCEGNLAMVFGQTGIGKSWFSYSVALDIARGCSSLGWEVPKARKVMYFDAEIDPGEVSGRLAQLAGGSVPDNLLMVSGLTLSDGLPPLDDPAAQDWYMSLVDEHDPDVLVIDNLCSVLVGRSIIEDQAWLPIQPLLNKLRARQKAVVIVHHAGKSGEFLGTSRMGQNLNTIIRLKRPRGYNPKDGASFNVSFDKGRSLYGDDAGGLTLRLVGGEGVLTWETMTETDNSDDRLDRVVEAVRSGEYATQTEVAQALGLHQSVISNMLKEAVAVEKLNEGEAADSFREAKRLRKAAQEKDPADH